MMKIRPVTENDTEAFYALTLRLAHETPFMLLEPDERAQIKPEQARRIQEAVTTDHQAIFVVEDEAAKGPLLGFIAATGGRFRRTRHSAHLVMGVLQTHQGQGLGKRLLECVEIWARNQKLRRLELHVMPQNERALGLYRRLGYEIEGTRTDSLRVGGEFVSEFLMAKILPVE